MCTRHSPQLLATPWRGASRHPRRGTPHLLPSSSCSPKVWSQWVLNAPFASRGTTKRPASERRGIGIHCPVRWNGKQRQRQLPRAPTHSDLGQNHRSLNAPTAPSSPTSECWHSNSTVAPTLTTAAGDSLARGVEAPARGRHQRRSLTQGAGCRIRFRRETKEVRVDGLRRLCGIFFAAARVARQILSAASPDRTPVWAALLPRQVLDVSVLLQACGME